MSDRTLADALDRAKSLRDFRAASPERFEKCPDYVDLVTLADEVERMREDANSDDRTTITSRV